MPSPPPSPAGSARARSPASNPANPGTHLAKRADPDVDWSITPHSPVESCGTDLSDAPVASVAARQVFDLPTDVLVVHRAPGRAQALSRAADAHVRVVPARGDRPACYGPALRAYVCYLVTRQHIPIARVAEL